MLGWGAGHKVGLGLGMKEGATNKYQQITTAERRTTMNNNQQQNNKQTQNNGLNNNKNINVP
jgi:hypothetical protein